MLLATAIARKVRTSGVPVTCNDFGMQTRRMAVPPIIPMPNILLGSAARSRLIKCIPFTWLHSPHQLYPRAMLSTTIHACPATAPDPK